MTLLSTIQRAAVLAGMPRPGTAAQAPDSATAQMVELARQDAEELAARIDWSALTKQQVFTTVAGVAQPSGLAADYARMTYNGELRQDARLWHLSGPTNDIDWDRFVQFPQGSLPSRWRIFGGQMQILPAPSAGQVLRYDYISRNLFKAADGTPKAVWDTDTDTCVIPEPIIGLGVIWRWRALKGLDYGEHMVTAENAISRAAGNDGGGRSALTAPRSRGGLGAVPAYPGVLGR